MPFQIIRNDITNMQVDAIVNTANPMPVIGAGTDAGIHQKAGPKLLEARKKIGSIRVGDAAITRGYDLDARYVIHTVGPVWVDGSHGEEAQLRRCYESSLHLALRHRCKSVAFPLISTGYYGFPKALALRCATDVIKAFLRTNDMDIFLVVFNRDAFRISETLFQGVTSYIDDHYARIKEQEEWFTSAGFEADCSASPGRSAPILRAPDAMPHSRRDTYEEGRMYAPRMTLFPEAKKSRPSLRDLLDEMDAGFTDTLLKLIDESGRKDSEVYKKANISKQLFSKIRKNSAYRPTKATALAFAIALELNLEQTRDLIGRAGYALTKSSKFDVIIMYFIEQRNYDIYEINAALFEFDQTLLGA